MAANDKTTRFDVETRTSTTRRLLLAVLLPACALAAIRVFGPPNILDQDQERPASYVLDVFLNGHWICQRDWLGDITSKPPMYTWLCAMFAFLFGRVNQAAMYLPGALAAIGSAVLVWGFSRKAIGERAALIAALACILSPAAAKQFGLARTDGVFAFAVTLTAVLGYRAWTSGRGWTLFWLAAAFATLTKGPLGLVLGAMGLLAGRFESKPLEGRSDVFVKQLPGIGLYLLLAGGWFALAYMQYGEALLNKMIGRELLGHVVRSDSARHLPGTLIYQQPLYYLGRAAPWSLLAFYGCWRVWRRPSPEATTRRFERFAWFWFVGGLLLFSLAPHQRADLLWPIMPAGALLAGIELDARTRGIRAKKFDIALYSCIAVGVLAVGYYYVGVKGHENAVVQTRAIQELARQIKQGNPALPLAHTDSPMALQFYLGTLKSPIPFKEAAELLNGSAPAFVAVRDVEALKAFRKENDPAWHQLLRSAPGSKETAILSNRPTLN